MPKPKYRTKNWKQYNQHLIDRGSITFWIDESAIAEWNCSEHHGGRGRGFIYSDTAIETALMVKKVFHLSLRALQGFMNSVFQLMKVPLTCPNYSSISKRAKDLDINIKFPASGEIRHLVIDSTGLKVFGEGEWKVKKHGSEQRRSWRKLHISVDAQTHDIIGAQLSLSRTTDSEVLPDLLKQTRRQIKQVSGDGAYDTGRCYEAIMAKRAQALIPPRKNAAKWEIDHPRNYVVICQNLTGSNRYWKKHTDYHQRSLSETAMFRFKTLFGDKLSLRHYNVSDHFRPFSGAGS